MSLRFVRGYWTAWRILPLSGKALLIGGYILSGIIYWSASIATPSPNAQCLTGPCMVTVEQVQTTRLIGIALILFVTIIFIIGLTAINVVMANIPDKAEGLLGFSGVSTSHFWNRLSPLRQGLSRRMKIALVLLWIFNGVGWGIRLPSVNPDSFNFLLIANGMVTFGTSLITIGTIAPKWLDLD